MKAVLAVAAMAALASAAAAQTPRPQDEPRPSPPAAGINGRDSPGPAIIEKTGPGAFDPRAIVNGAWALEYAMIVQGGSSPGAIAAQAGLDRLAAADYSSAIAAFQLSLADPAQNSLEAPTALLLGWAYRGAGNDREAITAWRRAASADPMMVSVHLAIADAYVRLSQPALAVQALHTGLAALPGSRELLDALARLEPPR
jgi:tetratricopeptide (TPR) repeat protein